MSHANGGFNYDSHGNHKGSMEQRGNYYSACAVPQNQIYLRWLVNRPKSEMVIKASHTIIERRFA